MKALLIIALVLALVVGSIAASAIQRGVNNITHVVEGRRQ